MQPDGNLVGHGARGDEQRRLFAQGFGQHFLKLVGGRVFVEHVVAHGRLGDGRSHGRGGASDSVAAQID